MQLALGKDPELTKLLFIAQLIDLDQTYWVGWGLNINPQAFSPTHPFLNTIQFALKEIKYKNAKTLGGKLKALGKLSEPDRDSMLAMLLSHYIRPFNRELFDLLKTVTPMDEYIQETWYPDENNFFGRLTKKQLVALAAEEGVELADGKRGDMASDLRECLPKDWEPKELR